MNIKFEMQRISYVWLGCALISLFFSIYLGHRFFVTKNTLMLQAKKQAQKATDNAAQELNQFIHMLKPIAQKVADTIGSKHMSKEEIVQLLKDSKPDDISGLGVAFLPYTVDPNTRLFGPYYVESQGKDTLLFIDKVYDYTKQDEKWFQSALKKGARFVEPYYGKTIKTITTEYVVPIYRTNAQGKKEAIGVVYADQSVEHLNHLLDTLFLNSKGYWGVLTKKGKYLAHPEEQLIHNQVSIFDVAKKLKNPELAQAAERILKRDPVFFEYKNEITGTPSWLFSKPLEGTTWNIIGVFDKGELDTEPKVLRHNLIAPSLPAVLFMIFLTLFIFSLFTKDHRARWWIASIIISLSLVGHIIWVWYASYAYPEFHEEKSYVVKNKGDLYDYLKKETTPVRYGIKKEDVKQFKHTDKPHTPAQQKEEALLHGYKNPRYVPTGIFVNSIQFIASNQIQLNGYVWQRFTKGVHDDIPRGITFPQASETKLTELSRITEDNVETIQWEVNTKLNQVLHFKKYPFDTKALQIQLWNRYTKQNIILIPDLSAYQLINPRSLPGIDDDTYIPGWDIMSSNFGYKQVNYTSNFGAYSVGPFGVYDAVDKSDVPELFFDVLIRRRLIDTLVSDLLPIAVIAVLLFVILLTSTQQKLGVIGSLSSVFFATIFAQIRFRSKIPEAQVVYFESFFFLMYVMLLLILIVTILKYMNLEIPFIQKKDNFFIKLAYWPVLFGLLSIITFWYLY